MEPKQLYDYALDQSLAVGLQVKDTQMNLPTPDSEWNVRDLLQHIMSELAWIPDIMAGKTVSEVGAAHEGDLLGPDPIASFQEAIEAARAAVKMVDLEATAHLSYADKPVHDYLVESADDILVHTWDLGQATGVSVVFDEAVAQTLYEYMRKLRSDTSSNNLFAEAVTVPDSANAQTKLLALLGRREDWADPA